MSSPDWAPSVETVASHLPMRTLDVNGTRQGTFDNDTTPNRNEVVDLAEHAASDVLVAVGGVLPAVLETAARRVAALLAACSVELSFFPDQIDTGRSPYDRLKTLYDEALLNLKGQVSESLTSTDPGSTASSGLAQFAFPPSCLGVGYVRW